MSYVVFVGTIRETSKIIVFYVPDASTNTVSRDRINITTKRHRFHSSAAKTPRHNNGPAARLLARNIIAHCRVRPTVWIPNKSRRPCTCCRHPVDRTFRAFRSVYTTRTPNTRVHAVCHARCSVADIRFDPRKSKRAKSTFVLAQTTVWRLQRSGFASRWIILNVFR